MDTVSAIEERLRRGLRPESVSVTDESAAHAGHPGAREGGHYAVTVVARAFAGQSPIARHRMIHAALGDLMGRHIHALRISALTPEEL